MGRRAYGSSSAGSGSAAASGGVSKVNTFANRATSFASPAAGDIFTASDSGGEFLYDGSVWRPRTGGGLGYEPADPSGWTWVNQGTSTMAKTAGRVYATIQDPGGTVTWRGKHTTMADPGNAAIAAHVRSYGGADAGSNNNIFGGGVYIRDSSTGNMVSLTPTINANGLGQIGGLVVATCLWTAGSFASSSDYFAAGHGIEWVRITNDAATALLQVSPDGSSGSWVTVRSVDISLDAMDQHGIGAIVYNSAGSAMWDSMQRS